ncbi:peroxidase family protein [Thalassoroseus pseudoceratinae]|uniref:peroxidase family protein n=1 Tax=Thalassoroseus pseudoceratinae TaxID=2713176 RepID=UPI00141F5458|nr:peroxidase family protein [Thalassoroseus pseudoceratinae]
MPRPQKRSGARHQKIDIAQVETVEDRVLLSAVSSVGDLTEFAPIDGVGNNVENPELGSTDTPLIRQTSVGYADGLGTPAGEDRPSPRAISNAVASQTGSTINDRHLTDYVWVWGQFLDHDISLTELADPLEPYPIKVPTGDSLFDPFGTGTAQIDLSRSIYEIDGNGIRQQINQITTYIDASNVYGSDIDLANELRTFSGGKLKTSEGDLLPYNVNGFHNGGGESPEFFLAGDIRANENAVLTSIHTVWVREHNRIADELARQDRSLSDEELYQQARAIVTAEIQAITFNEFLPALLGENAIDDYQGYDPNVDPSIANSFSTAAYRLGHSLLSSELQRLNNDGSVADEGNIELRDAFFTPSVVGDNGIDSLLVGASFQLAQELDSQVIDDIRNFLFGPPGAGGFDLASLNIQRGRDHGLADYNQTRIDLGLSPVTSFADVSSDPDTQAALASVYENVDQIDLWVGGLAEDHLPGSSVGELLNTILVDQFERLRDGDRFWYQNIFTGGLLEEIESTTLADVIERNTSAAGLQDNIFFSRTLQNSTQLENLRNEPIPSQRMDRDFKIVVTGDFDGSATEQGVHDDLFLWNPRTGTNRIILGNGAIRTNPISPQAINGNDFRTVVGGNFDNTGGSDLFFWNPSTGRNRIVHLDSGSFGQLSTVVETNIVAPTAINGNAYQEVVKGDFDQGGVEDLFLWNPRTGGNRLIRLDAGSTSESTVTREIQTNVISPQAINGNDFQEIFVGQFAAGGSDDILFVNLQTGRNRVAELTPSTPGGSVISGAISTNVIDSTAINGNAYTHVSIGDLNQDGVDELFAWNSRSGANRLCLINNNDPTLDQVFDEVVDSGFINGNDFDQLLSLRMSDDDEIGDALFFCNSITGRNRMVYNGFDGMRPFGS